MRLYPWSVIGSWCRYPSWRFVLWRLSATDRGHDEAPHFAAKPLGIFGFWGAKLDSCLGAGDDLEGPNQGVQANAPTGQHSTSS